METIDLRSDFLARPSEAMLVAAHEARDSYCFGLREDPWQQRLETRIAGMLGMQDALIFPTCTMANTTALMLLAQPGGRVLTQPDAHVLVSEAGAGAALGGLVLSAVDVDPFGGGSAAMPALAAWERAMTGAADAQRPAVQLCVLENTHNRSGGVALPSDYLDAVIDLARGSGVKLHMDGSRLFNASQALGVPLSTLARGFDTVSLSLNKTIGAPIAALLGGSQEIIARALVIRQRLGGGIRPTGPASAATLVGLTDLGHLSQVQELTVRLANGLAQLTDLQVQPLINSTNIVVARVREPDTANSAVDRCAALGLRILALDDQRIRFVVYRGIDAAQIKRAIEIVQSTNPKD